MARVDVVCFVFADSKNVSKDVQYSFDNCVSIAGVEGGGVGCCTEDGGGVSLRQKFAMRLMPVRHVLMGPG